MVLCYETAMFLFPVDCSLKFQRTTCQQEKQQLPFWLSCCWLSEEIQLLSLAFFFLLFSTAENTFGSWEIKGSLFVSGHLLPDGREPGDDPSMGHAVPALAMQHPTALDVWESRVLSILQQQVLLKVQWSNVKQGYKSGPGSIQEIQTIV